LTFIVAEIGVNWDGNFQLLNEMMSRSKKTGCDAVKLQAYNDDIVKEHPESKRLMSCAVTANNIKEIDRIAKDVGIEWFATPMYCDAVDLLEPYVKRFKIREYDGRKVLNNEQSDLFEKVLGTKKEIIISAEGTPKDSKYYGRPDIKWLYCVPKYPCELSDIDFTNISDYDGYSNHAQNIIAPLTSAVLGAEIVEFHITSDKDGGYIDNNVSFDFTKMESLVSMIRDSEEIKS